MIAWSSIGKALVRGDLKAGAHSAETGPRTWACVARLEIVFMSARRLAFAQKCGSELMVGVQLSKEEPSD